MRLPWKRRPIDPPAVAADWIVSRAWVTWEAPRNYIAGEASYDQALMKLTGPVCDDGYCRAVAVVLEREPSNGYDRNAIRATVDGLHVGYLRRHLAAQVALAIDGAGLASFPVAGVLRGGSTRAPNVGCHIWLDRCLDEDGPRVTLSECEPEYRVPWPPR
jgi:HIRAN domain